MPKKPKIKTLSGSKLEDARKSSARSSAKKNKYPRTLDELEEKCPGMLRRAKEGSKAKAIRAYCYICMGGYYPSVVKECNIRSCFLWRFRHGKGNEDPGELDVKEGHFYHDIVEALPGRVKKAERSRLNAIRLNCHMCRCTTGYALIQECEAYECPLWRYRMGKGNEDPKEVQELNDFIKQLDEEDDFEY